MSHTYAGRLFSLATIAVTISLLCLPCAQAEDAGKTSVQTAKGNTAQTDKSRNKVSSKKSKSDVTKAGACTDNNTQWKDGTHCTTTCNVQGTLCDMRICVKGSWKPYSSCFGSAAVSPNCPAACS